MRRRAEAREKPEKRGDEGEWRKKVEEGRLDHWNRWRGLREGGGGVCSEREREKGGGGGRLDAKRVDSALLDQGPLSLVGGGREDADTGGGGEGGARDEEGRLRRTRVRANRERE